jgi:hypothetical protein
MVLKMLPAEEADMYRSAVIEHEAYAPLETNQILFPGPFPTNILEIRAEQLKEQVQEPNVFCFKVIDTELEGEQMISFARWCVPPDRPCAAFHYLTGDIGMGRNYVLIILRRVVYDDTYPPKPKPRRGSPPGANAEAFDLLFDSLRELSDRSIGGRNIVCKQPNVASVITVVPGQHDTVDNPPLGVIRRCQDRKVPNI